MTVQLKKTHYPTHLPLHHQTWKNTAKGMVGAVFGDLRPPYLSRWTAVHRVPWQRAVVGLTCSLLTYLLCVDVCHGLTTVYMDRISFVRERRQGHGLSLPAGPLEAGYHGCRTMWWQPHRFIQQFGKWTSPSKGL